MDVLELGVNGFVFGHGSPIMQRSLVGLQSPRVEVVTNIMRFVGDWRLGDVAIFRRMAISVWR
jgi:hypothetical protein